MKIYLYNIIKPKYQSIKKIDQTMYTQFDIKSEE